MKKLWISMIILVVLAGFLAACAGPAATQPAATQPPASGGAAAAVDGKTLLEQRCVSCHSLDRATRSRGNADQWNRTVNDMVNKGAQLTADEQKVLVAYLAETYK